MHCYPATVRDLPVGRIGGLAVALGIGAAIGFSCGSAWATPQDASHPDTRIEPRARMISVDGGAARALPQTQRRHPQTTGSRPPTATRISAPSVGARTIAPPAASVSARANAVSAANSASSDAARPGPFASFLFNRTPTLLPSLTSQGSNGVVTGDLNVTDPDSSTVTFTVTREPVNGTVKVDAAGHYIYTADPAYVQGGTTDSFVVTVSDADGELHLHGLAGLVNLLTFGLVGDAGHTTSTTVSIIVNPASPALNPPSVERLIFATLTDSSITAAPGGFESPHVVINPSPSVTSKGELLVFLPGTQGRPSQYSAILRSAAGWGFYSVGLNYPNQTTMASLCRTSPDPNCYWAARSDVLFGDGTPVSGQSDVTPADSIVNRLAKLLVYMDATFPGEGWGQFLLPDSTVDWSKVVLAGHSQGGGHVGVMAKTVNLARAVYFSSPDDWSDLTNQPADWTLSKPNVTPAGRQYGFGSDADTLVPNSHAFAIWDNLGLARPGSGPVLVETSSAPFGDSHQLRTALPFNPTSSAPGTALKNHGITVVDTSTPLDGNGRPRFSTDGVWSYLLG